MPAGRDRFERASPLHGAAPRGSDSSMLGRFKRQAWGMRGVLFVVVAASVLALAGLARGRHHPAPAGGPPNIVFVLTDDLSWNLVSHMPNVQAMMADGATFSNYFVTDSLCCPSRATILTGEFPHNTDVLGNGPPHGGYESFRDHGDQKHVYARTLGNAGYETAFFGKYLNRYEPELGAEPYWDTWGGIGSDGYKEYDYSASVDGKVVGSPGYAPSNYLTDVLSRSAVGFVGTAKTPFALEVATFSPHGAVGTHHDDPKIRPGFAVPAPADDINAQCKERDFRMPRVPDFDAKQVHAPKWMDTRALTPIEKARLDLQYCKRAQAVESIDRMVGAIRKELAARGLAQNTYLVFNSDNGFHTGEHRLLGGKKTAFDEDIAVPLVVVGPTVKPGSTIDAMTSNIDLAPTFDEIAGHRIPSWVDGRSLLGLLGGDQQVVSSWRTRVLIEHRNGGRDGPDVQAKRAGDPPDYKAIRGIGWLYVEYAPGPRGDGNKPEFYRVGDSRFPSELDNEYRTLSARRKGALHQMLNRLATCRGDQGFRGCGSRAGAKTPGSG
jgi:N-acetylglucosamine-6-sulfatase